MALRDILADLRVRVRGTEQLRSANAGIGSAVTGLRAAGAAMAGAAAAIGAARVIGSIGDFAGEMIRLGDEVGKASARIGLSAEALQAWRFAAERSGVSAQAMDGAFARLQRSAFEASRGTASYRDSFRELGIDVEDASGELLGADDLMREVARAMGSLESETAKVALAQRLMGRSGAALLPLLNGGAEGAEALLARFEELGGGMGEDFVRNSEAAADALTDWDTATLGIKATLANSFLPTLTRILNGLAEWGAGVGELLRGSNVLEIALYSLAGVLGLVAASLLTIMAPVLVPLGILVLLVDDVTAAFQGGTSAIGTFVDELFGVGATAAVVQTVTDAWNALAEAIRSAYAAMTGNLDGGRARDVVDRGEENAARSGRIMGRPGEGYEAALARTNATRARLGLEPVGAEGGGARRGPRVAAEEVRALTGAPTVSSRSAGGPRATEITQHIGAPSIQMTINGAQDPEATSRAVQRALGDALRRTMGEAAATLPQGAAT